MNYQHVLEQTIGVPFTEGNKVAILKNGDEIFPAMLSAIDASKSSIDFLTFVYWQGNIAKVFAQSLATKAEEGVDVKVLLDSYGALPMNKDLITLMENSGVHVVWFRPLMRWKVWKADNRTHRKILICDNQIAFTGGVGIAEEWEGDARNSSEWRDTHFRIEGPAVLGMKSGFIENWIESNDALELDLFADQIPETNGSTLIQTIRTSSSVRWSDIVLLYQSLIKLAQKRIIICTAYFNPDQELVTLLCERASEGIDIRVLIPGEHTDQRITKLAAEDVFEDLLSHGIQISYYTKTMMHAKVMLIDEELSCIGSANFNHRSMLKDDEINLVLLDKGINYTLYQHFEEDLQYSKPVDPARWKKRHIFRRITEALVKPFKQEV